MISHAYKGQLVRGVTLEELRAFLTSVILRPAQIAQLRQVAAGAARRTHQARRPGGHHQARAAPGGQTQRQMKFHSHIARIVRQRLRLEIVFAVAGRGHLADRPPDLAEAATERCAARGEHADLRQLAGAHRRHGGATCIIYRVSPQRVAVTVSGPPDVMAVLQANQIRATVDLTGIDPRKIRSAAWTFPCRRRDASSASNRHSVGVIVPPTRETNNP